MYRNINRVTRRAGRGGGEGHITRRRQEGYAERKGPGKHGGTSALSRRENSDIKARMQNKMPRALEVLPDGDLCWMRLCGVSPCHVVAHLGSLKSAKAT